MKSIFNGHPYCPLCGKTELKTVRLEDNWQYHCKECKIWIDPDLSTSMWNKYLEKIADKTNLDTWWNNLSDEEKRITFIGRRR